MKKKRSTPSKSIKNRDRSPQSGDEIISARDRFKGALQDLLPHSDEETDYSDEEAQPTKSKRMAFQKKRLLMDKQSELDSSKYVMKLYDRSVDLAQFKENTPLYPICRAWIANQPHLDYNIKKEENKELFHDDVDDTYHLPPPQVQSRRQPHTHIAYESSLPVGFKSVQIHEQLISVYGEGVMSESMLRRWVREFKAGRQEDESGTFTFSETISCPLDGTEPPSKEDILEDNLVHWRKVRRNWLDASAKNDTRYEKSIRVLTAMYNKAQKQF